MWIKIKIHFTNGGSLVAKSCPTLATALTVAPQAPLSMGFSRQEYWSELPFPSPGDLPDLGIKPGSPALQADSLSSEPPGKLKVKAVCLYDGTEKQKEFESIVEYLH